MDSINVSSRSFVLFYADDADTASDVNGYRCYGSGREGRVGRVEVVGDEKEEGAQERFREAFCILMAAGSPLRLIL